MSYTIDRSQKNRVKFEFLLGKDKFDQAVVAAYNKTKHKYSVPGFRKGHVPMKMIEGMYGREVFFEDAMDIVIPEAYTEALASEKDIDPVDRPELESFDFTEDGGVKFVLAVTVRPEVKLGAYKGLGVARKVDKIGAKQVDEAVENARERQARFVDVDAPAENGNTVNIDFKGSVDGVPFDGGSAEGYDLELGSGTFIPGFEDQLVGVKAGEEKDVVVTFPEDYGATELQGKEAVFACKINAVKKKELPALDDEFAKDVSECDTLADYKAEVKARLTREAEDRADREYEDAVVKSVVDGAEVDIPEVMIDNEVEDMIDEFSRRIGVQGIKLEDYLGYVGMTREQLAAEYKVQAKVSVKTRLVMEEIVKREEMKFEEAELEAKIAEYAERYGRSADELKKDGGSEFMNHVANQVLSEKLMDMLKAENAAAPKASKAKKEEKAEDAEPKAEKPAKKAPAKKAPAKKAAADDKAEKPAKKAPAKKAPAKKTDGEN